MVKVIGAGHIQNDNMVSQLIRSSTALTLTLTSCAHVNVQGCNNLGLCFKFTKGNASGLVCRIETSYVNTNWNRELECEQTGAGTTLYRANDRVIKIGTTAINRWKWNKSLKNDERWVKISVKALTAATNSAVEIIALKSVI